MWDATIVGKQEINGALFVDVVYSSGEEGRNNSAQRIDMTGGSMDVLSLKIQSAIDTLNATDDFANQIAIGPFTPILPKEDLKAQTLSDLREKKNLVDLGVLEETDPEYTDAVAAVKAELNNEDISK